MKKISVLTLILLLIASNVIAAPFKTYGPIQGATHYIINGLPSCIIGGATHIPATPDGSITLDFSCIKSGEKYILIIRGCNMWDDCGPPMEDIIERPVLPPIPSSNITK